MSVAEVPDTIRRAALMLRLIAAVILVDCVAGFLAVSVIVDRTTELLGAEGLSMSAFLDASLFFQLAFAVALIVLGGRLATPGNPMRISAIVLSALALLGGIIGLFSVFTNAQEFEAVTRVLGADILPSWVLPVSVVLALTQLVVSALAIVNLASAKSAAFSVGESA